jgi:Domain of unknown function (DUF4920)
MKKYFIAILAIVVWSACNNTKSEEKPDDQNQADSTAVMQEEENNTELPSIGIFGEEITVEGAISAAELKDMLAANDSVEAKLMGDVVDVCQMKGCWMDIDMGDGETLTVRFKDYGFFVPKDCAGKEAIIEGKAKLVVYTVEELQHYAKDAGDSEEDIAAITEPTEVYEFTADGVIIQDKSE